MVTAASAAITVPLGVTAGSSRGRIGSGWFGAQTVIAGDAKQCGCAAVVEGQSGIVEGACRFGATSGGGDEGVDAVVLGFGCCLAAGTSSAWAAGKTAGLGATLASRAASSAGRRRGSGGLAPWECVPGYDAGNKGGPKAASSGGNSEPSASGGT